MSFENRGRSPQCSDIVTMQVRIACLARTARAAIFALAFSQHAEALAIPEGCPEELGKGIKGCWHAVLLDLRPPAHVRQSAHPGRSLSSVCGPNLRAFKHQHPQYVC